MSLVKVSGNASGTGALTIAAPNTNSDYTLTLPQATTTFVGTDATQTLTNKTLSTGLVMGVSAITSGTAVASTSGTSIDFTSLPAWVKKITVMFSGVSTNGTSNICIQLGTSGGVATTGYLNGLARIDGTPSVAYAVSTTSFLSSAIAAAADAQLGSVIFTNITGNTWVCQGVLYRSGTLGAVSMTAGNVALSGTLDRVRITTVNGTDTFDAGSINILYE